MNKTQQSINDYLEAIYALTMEQKSPVRNTDVAAYLGYKAPSITRAIAKLKQAKLLISDEAHGLLLTQRGRQQAEQIYEMVRFYRDALIGIGVEPEEAAQCASRLKHDLSPDCYAKLRDALSGITAPERSGAQGSSGPRSGREELSRRAAEHISFNYTKKFSLQELAGALHVDASYLARTFRDVTGKTLLALHHETRCEEACRLLNAPEPSITEIAYRVGFVSSAHFTRVFRKIKGCTPSEYRSAALGTEIRCD